jgi:pimeloyl-ACP methyl ester carboxylesterase
MMGALHPLYEKERPVEPILLIHGYGGESRSRTPVAISGIYGRLPEELRSAYGGTAVVELDVSRYVTLEDGVTLDDISRGFDRALQQERPNLLDRRFHVIVHSTGALVIRNWIRRFSPKPSPIGAFVHLAGANLGSGWAHLGRAQIAKWGRMVFQAGSERGVHVLDALELGSSDTLSLHIDLLRPGTSITDDYGVHEYVICGSQAAPGWFKAPIRYAKEDGSDGVVRVCGSNLNHTYVRFGPTAEAVGMSSVRAEKARKEDLRRREQPAFYERREVSRPGQDGRPKVPFAVPFACAHSGKEFGVVTGKEPFEQVFDLISAALETQPQQWHELTARFQEATDETYRQAAALKPSRRWMRWVSDPRAQYDPHAQVIVRIRDQDGRPVRHFEVFFDTVGEALPIRTLMEDTHVTKVSPGVIVFYLRTGVFDGETGSWKDRVAELGDVLLRITGVEPETEDILYLPFHLRIGGGELQRWIMPHRSTILDVELLRLPSPEIFRVVGN